MKKTKKTKRTNNFIRSICLLILSFSILSLAVSCRPKLDDAQAVEILKEKLPISFDVISAVYGELLYCNEEDAKTIDEKWTTPHYFKVDKECKYTTIAAIKADAEKVFTPTYLETVYEYAFVGNDETMSRFAEHEGVLTIDVVKEPYGVLTDIYPETAKVVKSNGYYAEITVDCSADGGKTIKSTVIKLSCVNGNWLFNGPTY